jgi:hypothetical protein
MALFSKRPHKLDHEQDEKKLISAKSDYLLIHA